MCVPIGLLKGSDTLKRTQQSSLRKKPPSLIPYSSGVLTLRRNRCQVVLCPVKSWLKHCDCSILFECVVVGALIKDNDVTAMRERLVPGHSAGLLSRAQSITWSLTITQHSHWPYARTLLVSACVNPWCKWCVMACARPLQQSIRHTKWALIESNAHTYTQLERLLSQAYEALRQEV